MQLQQLLAVKSTQHRNSAADTKITAQLRAATAGIREASWVTKPSDECM